jgi:hypothetical protein
VIYTMAQDVAATFALRGFPLSVHYGPERVSPSDVSAYSGRIVIARDRDRGDDVRATIGARGSDPRGPRVRVLGCEAVVYARSPLAGARVNEDEAICDQTVDALIVALCDWATEARAFVEFSGGKYLRDEEINGAERNAGVAYRLLFAVGRSVTARTYEGATRETAVLDGVTTTVRAAVQGTTYEDVPLDGGGGDPPEGGEGD